MVLEKIRATIDKYRMLRRGDSVLIGVSGGPDSVALLAALVALRNGLKLKLRAAYLDHGLRPGAARREAAFVKRLGRLWGVPVHLLRRKVRKSGGESLEAAARKARYETLAGLAIRTRSRRIALGHTRDDQAETVLIWLLRGTGTAGLAGIPPVREMRVGGPRGEKLWVIRPLIDCSRAELQEILRSHPVRPLKDRSNDSPRFLRNRIRRQLIPLLERQYNPQIQAHLSRLAGIIREDFGWLEQQARRDFRRRARSGKGRIRIDRGLARAPATLRKAVLRFSVERLLGNRDGFSARHWERLDALLCGAKVSDLDFPHGLRAEQPKGRWLTLRRSSGRL